MSLYEDFNNGSKAYYDEVPRYKNPYAGEGTDDIDNHAAWEKGWKQSSSEHNLFTENQRLKAVNEEFKELGIRWAEEKISLIESTQNFIRIVSADSQSIINYRDYVNSRDDLLYALVGEVERTNKFTFSREKMVRAIKSILKLESSFLEVKAPEVKKK